jgi:hypothetical protein
MSNATRRVDFSTLSDSLPRYIPRSHAHEILNGVFGPLFSKKSFVNFDQRGVGPSHIRLGGKIVYAREAILEWLSAQSLSLS